MAIIFQIGESCDPKIRGILGSLPSIFMSLAILTSYIIGSLVKWDILAWYTKFLFVKICFETNNEAERINLSIN